VKIGIGPQSLLFGSKRTGSCHSTTFASPESSECGRTRFGLTFAGFSSSGRLCATTFLLRPPEQPTRPHPPRAHPRAISEPTRSLWRWLQPLTADHDFNGTRASLPCSRRRCFVHCPWAESLFRLGPPVVRPRGRFVHSLQENGPTGLPGLPKAPQGGEAVAALRRVPASRSAALSPSGVPPILNDTASAVRRRDPAAWRSERDCGCRS